jgi:hypothetical protein
VRQAARNRHQVCVPGWLASRGLATGSRHLQLMRSALQAGRAHDGNTSQPRQTPCKTLFPSSASRRAFVASTVIVNSQSGSLQPAGMATWKGTC